ncbi:hypothetical protein ABKV19_007764 [Rosa sericea]
MSSTTDPKKLHIALFPWLAFGHIIPFLEVAKCIARRGHQVSFISTPRNIQRLPKIPTNLTPYLINLVQVPLPQVENLPENAEASMDVPHHIIPYLKLAHDGLEAGISEFLESHTDPDWIIHDFSPHWLPPIATKLGISRAYFSTLNAATVCFLGPTAPDVKDRYAPRIRPEDFTVPPEWVPFPNSKLAFRPFESKKIFKATVQNPSGYSDSLRLEFTTKDCELYLVRSCKEIEGEWLDLAQDILPAPLVLPVGLLPPIVEQSDEDKEDKSWTIIDDWLNKQEKGTVVYVALGTEVNPSQEDFTELALGLELSGLPFFWVLRKLPSGSGDGNLEIKLPDGFEDRTEGRGLVWRTWAPQPKILAHKSIGGFLTHCGWSSLIEGLYYGHPLMMFPFLYDQGLNARLWDKKVGIEVPRDEQSGSFTRDSVAKSLKLVMVDEDGKAYRDGAKEFRATFRDRELQDRYMDTFLDYLEKHKKGNEFDQ